MYLRYFLSFIILFSNIGFTQKVEGREVSGKKPIITFRLDANIGDSLVVEVLFGRDNRSPDVIDGTIERLVLHSADSITLNVPIIDRPQKIRALLLYAGRRLSYRNYIVSPGDSVLVEIVISGVSPELHFSGKGAAKYNCRYELERQQLICNEQIAALSSNGSGYCGWDVGTLNSASQLYQQNIVQMKNIVDDYAAKVTVEEYQGLLADAIASDMRRIKVLATCMSCNPRIGKEAINSINNRTRPTFSQIDGSAGRLSPDFVDYQINRITMDLMLSAGDDTVTFQGIQQRIIDTLHGELKDRALFASIVDVFAPLVRIEEAFYKQGDSLKLVFLNHAIKNIGDPHIRARLHAFSIGLVKGVDAYNFSLEDTEGRKVTLQQLKGNFVLMDDYFTGCGGCKFMAAYIKKQIKPLYQHRRDIKYVSVSLDRSKEVWLNTVRQEIYSSREDINLFTNGKGSDHEMLRYYNMTGFPLVFLIDKKGKIVAKASNPKELERKLREAVPL